MKMSLDTNGNANPDQKPEEGSDESGKEGTASGEKTNDADSETSLDGAQMVKDAHFILAHRAYIFSVDFPTV